MQSHTPKRVAVLGGGPAGLMAAWRLLQAGFHVTLLEQEAAVGGMCATQTFQGQEGEYRFDYGGHRFITKNPELLAFIDELMGDDLLHAERKSVIRFGGRTYDYPLSLGNLLRTAPLPLMAGALKDLLLLPFAKKPTDFAKASFAEWIQAHFGRTLYRQFFEGYTGKLWGIDPARLSADWAGQRISLIDLKDVARRLLPRRQGRVSVRTYARKYRYPRLGFGQIYTRLGERLVAEGCTLITQARVTGLVRAGNRLSQVRWEQGGNTCEQAFDWVISTLPLPVTCAHLGVSCDLHYRSLRFVNMPLAQENLSDNTWQYLSDPHILATRLQEPRRRSPFMAPAGKSSVMLEIPCNVGDETWNAPLPALRQRVSQDLASLGVDTARLGHETFEARSEYAYPLMDLGYQARRDRAIQALMPIENLIMAGRQGTFRYIFTDTAMEMGLMAADMVVDGIDRRHAIFNHRNENTVIETQSVA
ncbi:FAD-dependent oxidoreductase [Aeromonas simiae]|uniref:FAD-dependent oxidoreductase n=1 Tax=Aeromonas simiae TaxID=218936 RepID=UPI0005A71C4A|nr:FAD-dependent oxidoreductase [Aeromonas simiae]MDO2947873.1 FAD-dependent oxidoreductase [Aeromonas simiae]MDO2950954.1 FAD-dependent oxidoreductase [Aeromonas simiae]MDO2955231.1 FAD-dependent oxidoreductase [Aeromonas simiae]